MRQVATAAAAAEEQECRALLEVVWRVRDPEGKLGQEKHARIHTQALVRCKMWSGPLNTTATCTETGQSSKPRAAREFVRLLPTGTMRSWGNKDLASSLAFLGQTEFQKNWGNDAKDIILKPNEANGHLPLITALPCEGEKSVQKAAVSLLLPAYSKFGLNSVTATNKTDISNEIKSVFVQYANKAKTWMDFQTPISKFFGIVQAGLNNLRKTCNSQKGVGASLRCLLDWYFRLEHVQVCDRK